MANAASLFSIHLVKLNAHIADPIEQTNIVQLFSACVVAAELINLKDEMQELRNEMRTCLVEGLELKPMKEELPK